MKSGAGEVLLGVLAGVAVGATLGILFAPDKGSNTRRKISQKSNEYVEGLEEKFNELMDSFSEQIDHVKGEASRLSESGKQMAKEAAHDVVDGVKY
jgi:gas vesicle protein